MSSGFSTAFGQEAEEEEAQQTAADEEVIVTGTRIRRDDFTAPTATTVISADDMRNLGIISVADMVNQMPNNVASVSPEAGVESQYNLGASVANLRGLNTFFGTRTLTLVNNRRMVSTSNGGAVDMNMIPSALVSRIETVTGGASATYGADAMAGVVNVIMDDNVQDVTIELGYQTTAEGDGDRYNFSLGTGAQVFEGRGNFAVGIDVSDQEGIYDCTTRDYCRASRGILQNGEAGGGFGSDAVPYVTRDDIFAGFGESPEWIVMDGLRYTTPTGGMVWFDPYNLAATTGERLWRVSADGTDIEPYLTDLTEEEYAFLRQQGTGGQAVTPWGEGRLLYENQPLRPETQRSNLYTSFNYDLDGGITIDTSFSYGENTNLAIQDSPRENIQRFCVKPGNAYLSPESGATDALRDVMYSRMQPGHFGGGTNDWNGDCIDPPYYGGSFLGGDFDGAAGMTFITDMSGRLDRRNIRDTETTQFSVGADGDLFEGGSWTWDTYWSYGRTDTNTKIHNWQSDNRLEMALDSVWDPVLGPVCRINAENYVPQPASYYVDQGMGNIDTSLPFPTPDDAPEPEEGATVVNPWPTGVYDIDESAEGDWDMEGVRQQWYNYYISTLEDEYGAQAEEIRTEALQGSGFASLEELDAAFNEAYDPVNEEVLDPDLLALAEAAQAVGDAAIEDFYSVAAEDFFGRLSEGCAPFNPFGDQPVSQAALDFAFPTLGEGTEITQNAASINFSGELFSGIGAGPWRMAAGLDWRDQETRNFSYGDPVVAQDFSTLYQGFDAATTDGSGTNPRDVVDSVVGETFAIFGDGWHGASVNTEAFIEFDFPLLRDKIAAQELTLNIANRRTRNESERFQGSAAQVATAATRYNDSWSARLSWQPVDVMRMRVTRSADTRAPSAQELFQTNTAAQSAGGEYELFGGQTFREDLTWCESFDPFVCTGTFANESAEVGEVIQGGNAALSSEVSTTETFGLVFTPITTVPGLSASIDYYETFVDGGIERLGSSDVVDRCEQELANNVPEEQFIFCNLIVFGPPDQQQRWYTEDPNADYYRMQFVDVDPTDGYFSDVEIENEDGTTTIVTVPTEIFPYGNILTLTTSNQNVAPFWSRGLDLSISYNKQLAGGGNISGRVIATRFLEQSIVTEPAPLDVPGPNPYGGYGILDVSGQTGSNGLAFSQGTRLTTNYSPTPRISGNMFMTYQKNAFSVTAQLRYIGKGRLFEQGQWIAPGEHGHFYVASDGLDAVVEELNNAATTCVPAAGDSRQPPFDVSVPVGTGTSVDPISGDTMPVDFGNEWLSCQIPYGWSRAQTVEDSTLPSWATLNVNMSYDFGLSRFSMDRFQSLQVFLNVTNVGDRIPDFFSGNGAGGINTTFFSGMGREYNMGVRMSF